MYFKTFAVLAGFALGGCASWRTQPPADTTETQEAVATEEQITQENLKENAATPSLESRISELEKTIQQLKDSLEATQIGVEGLLKSRAQGLSQAQTPSPVEPKQQVTQIQSDFVDAVPSSKDKTNALSDFREAKAFIDNNKNAEAILALSHFLEKYPEHTLSGSAQFLLGECYYGQKELKIALEEYYRVITTYDKSPRVSHALRRIIEIEDHFKNKAESDKYRQILLSSFPNSPAAEGLELSN